MMEILDNNAIQLKNILLSDKCSSDHDNDSFMAF